MDCQVVDCQSGQPEGIPSTVTTDDSQAEERRDEIVTICSEESITRAAASHIEEALNELNNREKNVFQDNVKKSNDGEKSKLTRRVQLGEITPFQADEEVSSTKAANKRNYSEAFGLSGLEHYLKRQAELSEQCKKLKTSKITDTGEQGSVRDKKDKRSEKKNRCVKKRGKKISLDTGETNRGIMQECRASPERTKNLPIENNGTVLPESGSLDSGSEYIPSDREIEESDGEFKGKKRIRAGKKCRAKDRGRQLENSSSYQRILDDGDEAIYRERMESRLREGSTDSLFTVDNLFKVPKSIWKRLYKYQRVSVRWLWELHGRGLGGLLGDEMGLGKTVQVIAFLAGLDASELLSDGGRFRGLGPALIICPATLLEQWVKHFRDWAPSLRVAVLHHSGTYRGDPEYLIESVSKTGGVIVTSYSGVLRNKEHLLEFHWHYVILDEGHKIRNPEAKVTRTVKKFSTPHRILLTGSPMQNSLKELWSLFDFILPGKLGTLSTFLEHCANPITRGGYANASPLQEATALQVATMLKDAIAPYMLRRTKNDVQHHIKLPEKNEQVLFCSLTEVQKSLYKDYLRTDHVSSVLHDRSNQSENSYRARLLVALTNLRKICNHPDLYICEAQDTNLDSDDNIDLDEKSIENFGHWKRSGKLAVVRSLLKIWKRQGHRVLLFTQGRQMMCVLEALAQREGHTYLRLDGTTPMSQRQQTIHKFNEDSNYFVFISTTRVGGLGINLTGANRVVIYDPDWNPAVDAQARERAWRIGQDKRVTIYRLITAGTVEEKIYHRQIFKVLLSNRVLKDPRQRRLFRTSDLAELFNLNEPLDGRATESDRIFRDCKLEPTAKLAKPKFSSRKIEAMKKLAATVSKKIQEIAKKNVVAEDNVKPQAEEPVIVPSDSIEKSRRKKRHKKTNAEFSAMFEGEKVPCLIGRRLGQSEMNEEQISSTCDDQYVLNKLFSKTKVNSAIQHDAVISNARSDGGQVNPMNRMARDAAQESMELLRQSRKWCWRPMWDSAKEDE